MVMEAGHEGTSQQTGRLDIAVPMVSGNHRGLAECIATVQDLVLFARTDLREQQSIHPSHQRLAGGEGTLVDVIILLKRYQRCLSETGIGTTEEREGNLSLLDTLVTILHAILEELCDIRSLGTRQWNIYGLGEGFEIVRCLGVEVVLGLLSELSTSHRLSPGILKIVLDVLNGRLFGRSRQEFSCIGNRLGRYAAPAEHRKCQR